MGFIQVRHGKLSCDAHQTSKRNPRALRNLRIQQFLTPSFATSAYSHSRQTVSESHLSCCAAAVSRSTPRRRGSLGSLGSRGQGCPAKAIGTKGKHTRRLVASAYFFWRKATRGPCQLFLGRAEQINSWPRRAWPPKGLHADREPEVLRCPPGLWPLPEPTSPDDWARRPSCHSHSSSFFLILYHSLSFSHSLSFFLILSGGTPRSATLTPGTGGTPRSATFTPGGSEAPRGCWALIARVAAKS